MEVSIVDYGMGNIKSVLNALEFLGAEPKIVKSPKNMNSDKVVLPGVGAFGDAMENLEAFAPKIEGLVASDVPLLGICLGMQAFFEGSDESPQVGGLGLLRGQVTKVDTELKLPHIGWNSLEFEENECPIFEGIKGGYVYYAHSYHVVPEDDVVVATSEYGTDITASVREKNIFGTQFHPEKSGKLGLRILKNFLEI